MIELTIVLPTKNSEKYIVYFLDSLKKQDYNDYIIYLADGDSTDKTLSIFESYNFNYKIISKSDDSAEEESINVKKLKQNIFILNSDDYIGETNYLSGLISLLKNTDSDVVSNFGSLIQKQKS